MNRVVITGYGAICALGENAQAIWQAVLNKQLGYAKIEDLPENINARFFGKINQPLKTGNFSKRILKNTPRFAQLALIAAQEAIDMAFGQDNSLQDYYSESECGVIAGTGWGGFDNTAANYFALQKGTPSIQSCFHTMPSIATAAIAINWNLKGYQSTPVAACATGNIAIGEAFEIIRSGRMKMMVAGGAESTLDPFPMWSIDVLGALSKEQDDPHKACCPFSKDRSGFILAEGGAMVCLESREQALQRNAVILGEIVGYGNHSDAYVNLTAPAPDLTGRIATINQALNQAGLQPEQIDYINAHGTSTPMNDRNETDVLKQVFGDTAWHIPISSTKSYTGHLIAAAGAIETLFCIKSIQDKIVPATINYHTPDPQCDLNYVPNAHLYNQKLKHVINVNYGFGGANSCLVIKEHIHDD